MKRFELMLLLLPVTFHFLTARVPKRSKKIFYQPYGPLMCRAVCTDSKEAFSYIIEDLSCQASGRESDYDKRHLSDDSTEKDLMVTTTTLKSTHQNCSSYSKGFDTGAESSYLSDSKHHNYTRDLHKACQDGNLCLVKIILFKKLADISCRGAKGATPVMTAVRHGQNEVFDFLVHMGCDLTVRDYKQNNVLHGACAEGNVYVVKELIFTHNYDIESKGWMMWTPVMYATSYGHIEVVDLLLKEGCNYSQRDKDKDNMLHLACWFGNVSTVKYFLDHNMFNIESRGKAGRTPAMIAASLGHTALVEFLVSGDCNLTATDNEGNNILHLACIGGHIHTVKHMLELNIVSGDRREYSQRASVLAGATFRPKEFAVLRIVDIDSRGKYGQTPAMFAAICDHGAVVELLIKSKCNVFLVNNLGCNILHLACCYGSTGEVEMILKHLPLKIDSRTHLGRTPLMMAVRHGRSKTVALLISRNSDLEAVDIHGNNILHIACKSGDLAMVKQILNLGIMRLNVKNKLGLLPEKLAEKKGHIHIVSLFRAQI